MTLVRPIGLSALALALAVNTACAVRPAPADLPAARTIGQLEHVFAFYDAMPTGVTVTETGRIFVNFPRWGDDVPFTVAEIKDGRAVAYPDPMINLADPKAPADSFISVQSVVADGQGRLWVLDTAAPSFEEPQPGGAKLIAIDLKTDKVVKTLVFPSNVILPTTYVNDMRFDFRTGKEGTVYVTDSSVKGPGAIIVMDIASGKASRRLNGHVSTSPEAGFIPKAEGEAMLVGGSDGEAKPFSVAVDGIALSPDGQTLYYCALTSRNLYSVPTRLLRDPNVTEAELANAVQDLGEKGASDGLEADATGAVYAGDYEHNGIRKRLADGTWQTIVHDPRVLWPDSLSIGPDGYLYFTANQVPRQPSFQGGRDLRVKPYSLFRVKIDAAPAPTR